MNKKNVLSPIKKFWSKLGPGFITGSSDDDPSGVATYATTGASYGYSFLWMAWFAIPFMIAVQEMSARIGLVTGRGLIGAIKERVPRPILFISVAMLFIANSINVGADIGAMADATRLLAPSLRFTAIAILFTVICILLQVFVSYDRYVSYLKWLTLSLFSYIAVALYIDAPMRTILIETFSPDIHITRDVMLIVTAILGTTISPYLMYWQASEEVEEEIAKGRKTIQSRIGVTRGELKDMRFDVSFGMIFSNIIMFFIIMTTAAVLFGSGATIETAADAARVLEPLAGSASKILFAFGIIGTGLLAVPVLAGSAAYAICELYGWKSGLFLKWHEAKEFYAIIAVGTALGLLVNFSGIPPMKALVWTAVINGLVAPFTIALLLIAGNDKHVMGRHANSKLSNLFGVLTLLLMVGSIVLYFIL